MKKVTSTIINTNSEYFRLRYRKGRNIEVQFENQPGVWTSTGTSDVNAAIEYAKRCYQRNGLIEKNKNIRLKDFANNFFNRTDCNSFRVRQEKFGKAKAENYYSYSQGRLDNYILPRFGNYAINMISGIEIETWYINLKSTRTGEELSPSSKSKIMYNFSAIMEDAKRQGLIDKNPCDDVEMVTNKTVSPRKPFLISEVQKLFPPDLDKAVKIWHGLKWATYFSIMVDTGFRAGEVAGLTRNCIINNGIYSVSSVDAFTRKIKNSIKTSGKGQSYKVGTLSSYSMKLLWMYLETVPESQELLFLNNKGECITPEVSNKHLRFVLREMGIPVEGRSQHCFRHFFDTFMLSNLGADIKSADVKELMAHTGYRPEYDHRTPEDIVRQLEKVRPAIETIRNVN